MTRVPAYGPLVPLDHLGTQVMAFRDRPRNHDQLLRAAAHRWPDRTAVQAPSGTVTYAELDRMVDGMCAALTAQGVRRGDRIAVALSHDLPLYCCPFVCSRAELTVLLLNTTLSPPQWAAQLDRAGTAVIVTDAAQRAAVAAAAGDRRVVPVRDALPLAGAGAAARSGSGPDGTDAHREAAELHPLALIATSGTTGVPKMTTVTSRGLIHAALAYVTLLGLAADDRAYVCLPLHYIGPLSAQTTTMPLVGGCAVLPDDTRARGALARMAAADITYVDAVPAWLNLLAREPGDATPGRWRTLIYGGAPMPHETAVRLAARFPDLRLWDVWGLSETHGPATAQRHDPRTPALPGTVGRPIAGVEVRTDADAAAAAPSGRPGELLVRGANVTTGYHDDPALSARVLAGGWLRTGDIGTVGPDGTVRLLDRAKDVILRGGSNVFSVEVEQVLGRAPAVSEAAVFGVPDGLGGEAVAAVVVLQPACDLDVLALRQLVAEQVGAHAVPRHVHAVASLPRNATGKVDKARLRMEYT